MHRARNKETSRRQNDKEKDRSRNRPDKSAKEKKEKKPRAKRYKCELCFRKYHYMLTIIIFIESEGRFMADCGCFYCKQCYKDSDSCDDFEKLCMVCGKNKTRAFDLNDKQQFKMVERNLLDPLTFMANGRKLIEFQELH